MRSSKLLYHLNDISKRLFFAKPHLIHAKISIFTKSNDTSFKATNVNEIHEKVLNPFYGKINKKNYENNFSFHALFEKIEDNKKCKNLSMKINKKIGEKVQP